MINFTKINSIAYLSLQIISSLILSRVKLRQLQHWYNNIGDEDIEFGQGLIQQDFDAGIPVWTAKSWPPKNADFYVSSF